MAPNPIDQLRDDALAARGLPEIAFIDNASGVNGTSPVIAVKRGEPGYYPIHTRCSADELNESVGVTPAQREAMLNGSMFGWHVSAANPYSEFVQRVVATELLDKAAQRAHSRRFTGAAITGFGTL